MELVIASNNKGKIHEITNILQGIDILSLRDIGFNEDIPEPYDTFKENAHTKAATVHAFCGKNVFADDSGICANALDGAPGVFSARYAGEPTDDERNLQKLLENLKDKEDRSAYYKAVLCLIWQEEIYYFEGICNGLIATHPRGIGGFGYDPVFIPDGYEQTFAELPLDLKNQISHRGKAVRELAAFVKKQVK